MIVQIEKGNIELQKYRKGEKVPNRKGEKIQIRIGKSKMELKQKVIPETTM